MYIQKMVSLVRKQELTISQKEHIFLAFPMEKALIKVGRFIEY